MAAGDDARQGYAQSEYLVAKDLKGPSAFDQSHALMARFQYEVPTLVFRLGRTSPCDEQLARFRRVPCEIRASRFP